jgi:hypothetical protein
VKIVLLALLGGVAAIAAALTVKSRDEIARYNNMRKM